MTVPLGSVLFENIYLKKLELNIYARILIYAENARSFHSTKTKYYARNWDFVLIARKTITI